MKERIVGAIVLVVFIVLVVPVFLDGPAEAPGMVSENVTLPGQNGQERKRQTIVLERDRSEPVPVSSPPAVADEQRPPEPRPVAAEPKPIVAEPAKREEVQVAEAAASPPPQPEPAAAEEAVRSSTGMWAVQLGSFSNKANAERLAAELRQKGYAAFLSQLKGNSGPLHRVRIGPQKDRDSAEATAARLVADGHKGQVVPHP